MAKLGSFNWYLFRSGDFVQSMAVAIQRADPRNRERIRAGFPQMVAAHSCEDWDEPPVGWAATYEAGAADLATMRNRLAMCLGTLEAIALMAPTTDGMIIRQRALEALERGGKAYAHDHAPHPDAFQGFSPAVVAKIADDLEEEQMEQIRMRKAETEADSGSGE